MTWAKSLGAMLLLSVNAFGTVGAVAQSTPQDVAGVWLDATGEGAIELKPCDRGICGTIVWLKVAVDSAGRPVRDVNNQDRAKRSQPLCNLQLIGGGTRLPNGSLEKGWIYNPDDGGRYDVDITRIDATSLKVHGYLGMKFLGETFIWRKAPDDLKRCST